MLQFLSMPCLPWTLSLASNEAHNAPVRVIPRDRSLHDTNGCLPDSGLIAETIHSGNSGPDVPRTNIVETAGLYVVSVELPGLKIGDVTASVEDRVLTITGIRNSRPLCGTGHYISAERATGPFVRTYSFLTDVCPETMTVGMSEGLLTIVIKKTTHLLQSGAGGSRLN